MSLKSEDLCLQLRADMTELATNVKDITESPEGTTLTISEMATALERVAIKDLSATAWRDIAATSPSLEDGVLEYKANMTGLGRIIRIKSSIADTEENRLNTRQMIYLLEQYKKSIVPPGPGPDEPEDWIECTVWCNVSDRYFTGAEGPFTLTCATASSAELGFIDDFQEWSDSDVINATQENPVEFTLNDSTYKLIECTYEQGGTWMGLGAADGPLSDENVWVTLQIPGNYEGYLKIYTTRDTQTPYTQLVPDAIIYCHAGVATVESQTGESIWSNTLICNTDYIAGNEIADKYQDNYGEWYTGSEGIVAGIKFFLYDRNDNLLGESVVYPPVVLDYTQNNSPTIGTIPQEMSQHVELSSLVTSLDGASATIKNLRFMFHSDDQGIDGLLLLPEVNLILSANNRMHPMYDGSGDMACFWMSADRGYKMWFDEFSPDGLILKANFAYQSVDGTLASWHSGIHTVLTLY